jgi:eukaryotic-like serine/threonine-protein kinase
MITCSSCSANNAETSKFCSECGVALKPEYAVTITPGARARLSAGHSQSISDSSHHGRFLPGTNVADRYRIVSLLGKGGMGEVYRADDLKLGNTVALKFLPTDLADDPKRLEHFHSEVRLARQISHPNVCRVYDIGEVHGQHFLSMEYIDGEDLQLLLRRISRLPSDKGIQIAQELCAGLAAAHEQGVLHRDLKPANIMIDGRGHVRITDFGLAKLAEDDGEEEVAGTPAYMAPEQLVRGEASIQSDLFSLGLILCELFTGEAVHKTGSIPELIRVHKETSPSRPLALVENLEPDIERAILQCLKQPPHERPNSAHAVAAALPGSDPLTAALAAGVTPSPAMVAAAGETSGLAKRWAVLAMIGVAVGLLVNCWLAETTYVVNRADLQDEPAVLASRVREIVRNDLGYRDRPRDAIHGFHTAGNGSLRFWYRQRAESPLATRSFWTDEGLSRGRATFRVPSWELPQELGVKLTAEGKLDFFRAIPLKAKVDGSQTSDPSRLPWSDWFPPDKIGFFLPADDADSQSADSNEAGLVLTIVNDQTRTPPDAFDAIRVWKGVDQQSGKEFYVEAAAYRGKPVYLEVFSATRWAKGKTAPARSLDQRLGWDLWNGLIFAILIGAGWLAWHNMRSGRSDRRGAMRLAKVAFAGGVVLWLARTHHVSSRDELNVVILGLSQALWEAARLWLLYIALEPLVRRIWPQILITWTRLLEARFRDPVVGRDLLLGVSCGVVSSVLFQANVLAHLAVVGENSTLTRAHSLTLAGPKELISFALQQQLDAFFYAMGTLFVLLMLRILLRSERSAMAAFMVVFTATLTLVQLQNPNFAIALIPVSLHVALVLFVLVRLGFLALLAQLTVLLLAHNFPLTLNTDDWYFGHGMFAVVVIAAIAFYGFRTSHGGQSSSGTLASQLM